MSENEKVAPSPHAPHDGPCCWMDTARHRYGLGDEQMARGGETPEARAHNAAIAAAHYMAATAAAVMHNASTVNDMMAGMPDPKALMNMAMQQLGKLGVPMPITEEDFDPADNDPNAEPEAPIGDDMDHAQAASDGHPRDD